MVPHVRAPLVVPVLGPRGAFVHTWPGGGLVGGVGMFGGVQMKYRSRQSPGWKLLSPYSPTGCRGSGGQMKNVLPKYPGPIEYPLNRSAAGFSFGLYTPDGGSALRGKSALDAHAWVVASQSHRGSQLAPRLAT
ncbi:MAG: hypothetical protein U0871_17820 [Gemmataceae bacterium]